MSILPPIYWVLVRSHACLHVDPNNQAARKLYRGMGYRGDLPEPTWNAVLQVSKALSSLLT